MPIRGRQVRRSSTNDEALPVDGSGTARLRKLKLLACFKHAPYIQLPLTATFVLRPIVQLPLTSKFVKRSKAKMPLRATLVNRSSDTRTINGFKILATFGEETGYPAGPRIVTPYSLVIGQPLRTHREVIQGKD